MQLDGDDLPFRAGNVPAGFRSREITLAPGTTRGYDESEWQDSLVVVERGTLELLGTDGSRTRFGRGGILWLTGLTLRALHNPGSRTAVLRAVSRRPGPRHGARDRATDDLENAKGDDGGLNS